MSQCALVTGATGLLGRQVLKAFERAGWDAVGTGFSRAEPPKIRKVDIQNEDEVVALLDEVKPRVVVHCAAERRPDNVTANPSAAHKLNVTATATLAQHASTRAIFLIYISTDYVFSGRPGEAPYTPTSPTSPTNTYGTTKLAGEHAVLAEQNGGVVLRVPVLYGPTVPRDNNAESAVNILLDALDASQSRKIPVDHWAIRYPTNTEDVARVCVDVARVYTTSTTSTTTLPRVLQFSSQDRMTKYEICTVLAEIMDLPVDGLVAEKDGGEPTPTASGGAVTRPYDCHLSTDELKGVGVDVSTVDFVAWWRRYLGAFRR